MLLLTAHMPHTSLMSVTLPYCRTVVLSYCRTIVLPGWGECADNRIGVEGAKAIAEALTTNTTLTTLNLGSELLCDALVGSPTRLTQVSFL